MNKFFRGTSTEEANALATGVSPREISHWTDSKEKASMYSKGAVIEIVMDELPAHFNQYKSIAEGDSVHGNIREWKLPKAYFESTVFNFVEDEDTKIWRT